MKSFIIYIVLILLVIFFLFGCSIRHQARLYDLETGDVILGVSKIRSSSRATAEFVLPSGEKCKGESVTVQEGSVSWGNIYSFYYGSASYSSTNIPLSQRGISVYICDRGTTFECEYTASTSGFSIHGHGVCRDNRGKYYRAIF
jgi:hypothetical protein